MKPHRLATAPLATAMCLGCGVRVDHGAGTLVQSKEEHAVLVHLKLTSSGPDEAEVMWGQELEELLEKVVRQAGVGLVDGNEIGEGEFVIYIYGSDASRIVAALTPQLSSAAWPGGGYVQKRLGPPGAPEERIALPLTP